MDKEKFVQNVKRYCAQKGVKPTVACAESGAGKDLIGKLMGRGSVPSIEKVQLLAQYLGCTVSDLLGESPSLLDPTMKAFADAFMTLTPENREAVLAEILKRKEK